MKLSTVIPAHNEESYIRETMKKLYPAMFMAEAQDLPGDLIPFYRKMIEDNYDSMFSSGFDLCGRVVDYLQLKLIINRMANAFIRILFGLLYNDVTNAFKFYRRETIYGLRPFLAPHFNITVELTLKSITLNYSYT